MAACYLFVGENDYLRLAERRRWIQEFEQKHGNHNCLILDGSKTNMRTLMDEASAQPFLASKRLIVVDGVPKASGEEVELLLRALHPDAILLFVDAKPDKRQAGVKKLLAEATVEEFEPLKAKPLLQWMREVSQKLSLSISDDALLLLTRYLGEDQYALITELTKLSLRPRARSIESSDIENECIAYDEGVVWKLTDHLVAGRTKDAVRSAKHMMDCGVSPFQLWALLLSFARNLTWVYAGTMEKKSSKDVAAMSGIHPFAISTMQPAMRRIDPEKLMHYVRWMAQQDRNLKTGVLRSTDEFPQELQLLIDQSLLRCPL